MSGSIEEWQKNLEQPKVLRPKEFNAGLQNCSAHADRFLSSHVMSLQFVAR